MNRRTEVLLRPSCLAIADCLQRPLRARSLRFRLTKRPIFDCGEENVMTKKCILWDHDGVLVDTEKWYYEANKRALAELNIVIDFKQYMEFMQIGKSVWAIPREKGIDENLVLKAREHRDQYYQDYLQTKNIEIPHVEEVLKNLSKKYLMCIVTTAKKKDFDLIHKNRKIMDHMQFALTLGEYKRSKPHPDPYLTALEKFGGKKEEAVVVEDSARGLKAAIAAGIECIIVRNDFTHR